MIDKILRQNGVRPSSSITAAVVWVLEASSWAIVLVTAALVVQALTLIGRFLTRGCP